MAQALAGAGIAAVYSYAGVVAAPRSQPLPVRVGGFGGIAGLCTYCRAEGIGAIIDATHPFAAQMSNHAVAAAAALGLPLAALERPPWQPVAGDRWIGVASMAEAAQHLVGGRVFLGIGRNELAAFGGGDGAQAGGDPRARRFLLRLVDPPQSPPLANADWVVARGPFTLAGDLALLRAHDITCIVSKNAGGSGAYAKIEAARALSVPVVMVARPQIAPRLRFATVAGVMGWLEQGAALGAAHDAGQLRGV